MGDLEARSALLEAYKRRVWRNTFWILAIALIFLAGLFYHYSGGLLLWYVLLIVIGNRVCLKHQLKRIEEIEAPSE